MGFFTWTYIDREDKQHHVGLYHGEKSGHVMIYIGKKIMTIDFNILETKSYTFFLNDELCEIKIERRKDRFYYTFNLDRATNTPLNQARKIQERKHWLQTLAFLGGIVLIVVFLFWGFTYLNKAESPDLSTVNWKENAAKTSAKITLKDEALHYYFTANNTVVKGEQTPPKHPFPLQTGDEFTVIYSPKNPNDLHDIKFNQPIPAQVVKYKALSLEKHAQLHPEQSVKSVRCLVQTAYARKGMEGLATIFLQEKSEAQNAIYNKTVYQSLINNSNFQQLLEACASE